VRSSLGEDGLTELVSRSGVPHGPDYLDEVTNWVPYEDVVALFEAASELMDDRQIGRRLGEDAVRQHAGTHVATLLRSLGSPERIYEQIAATATKFSTVTELVPLEVAPGHAAIRGRNRLGIPRHPLLCDYTRGLLSQPPVLFGLPAALVEETSCAARGDEHCMYEVTWDAEGAEAAASPQALVTALEAQLAAMRERLESMYAMAGELIAVDDLDGALARITDRAAEAVRAPSYLLAVRTGDRVHVHARGLENEDCERLAEGLLDGSVTEDGDTRLVANVASSRRHYGRLMAVSPTGGFFPSEQDLFCVYARYAAAVLDSATALEEARRQHELSHGLLELSQALAVANTRDEVAERIAEAVPAVIDCDRVVVYLWDDEQQVLLCRAATGARADDPALRELQVTREDSAGLERMEAGEAPTAPRFLDRGNADPFTLEMMDRLGSQVIVGVPIWVRGTFHGALGVAAMERPERLADTPELRERLTGVAAQAGTALENARLVESVSHQALHDGLTGLLGHRAFHESLAGTVSSGPQDTPLTLAMVDIDGFKAINDEHGHPVGDEALRLVTEALRRAVRDDDTVFRVGGDEFAVLFRGVGAERALPIAERLREEVERIEFGVPLRVSVGLAAWPHDAVDRDGLLKIADAALYEAKRAGKNRTTVAATG
jgi:diguanylate cyclase (GGDEF)-like protein